MRVFLIYPPITFRERYSSDIGRAGGRQAPLGLLSLAAYVREKGHEVGLVDAEAQGLSPEQAARAAQDFGADVIGISSTTVAFHRALETARHCRRLAPGVTIVLGGPHLTVDPEASLSHKEFDYGVLGEGEIVFTRLLEALESGEDPSNLKGLVLRKEKQVIALPRQPFIDDMDSLPFPAHDLIPDLSAYNPPPCNYEKLPVASLVTTRGCPKTCTFCDRSVLGQGLRKRSAQNIAQEIQLLIKRFRIREIAFMDDAFTLDMDRVYRLFSLLSEKGLRFPWTCMSHLSSVDFDLLHFMHAHGCWHISFGIESGNEAILRRIRKKIFLKRARKVLAWCRDLGILTKGFFILGHPGETEATMEETIRFALETPLDDVVVTLNTPMPGCEQYKLMEKYGSLVEKDWARYNLWNPVFVPHGLAPERLLAKQKEFYRRFYLRPRPMARYAKSLFTRSGFRRGLALAQAGPYLLKKPLSG